MLKKLYTEREFGYPVCVFFPYKFVKCLLLTQIIAYSFLLHLRSLNKSTVSGNCKTTISGNGKTTVSGNDKITVSGNGKTIISGNDKTTVSGNDKLP